MASRAVEDKRRAVAKASTEATRRAAQPKRFGIADIAKGLSNPYIQGAAQGTDIAGGESIAGSVKNVATGKATPMDALNLGLAAAAFTGLGSPAIAQGARAIAPAAAAKLAVAATKRGNVAVRFPSSKAGEIAQSGGLTNAFETIRRPGLNETEYMDYLAPRIKAEQEILGISPTTPAAQRPVYGFNYLPGVPAIKGNGPLQLTSQTIARSNPSTKMYGDVTGVLKRNASKDATFTIGDSFVTKEKAFGLGKANSEAKSAVADAAAKSKIESYKSMDAYIRDNLDQYKESYRVYKDMFRPEDAWLTGETVPKTWDEWLAASKQDFFTGQELAPPIKESSAIGYIEVQLPFAAGNINNFKKFIADTPQAKQAVEVALREAGIKAPVKLSLEAKAKALQELLRQRKSSLQAQ